MPDIITLDNGLRVVWQRMAHLRSVSVGIWVKAGSMLESEAENGLSHLNEHMSFKGSHTWTGRELAMRMDMIGGNVNAATSKTLTMYYANVTDEKLPEALRLLSEIVLHPKMDADDIAREKNVVLEEIRMAQDSYEDVADDLISRATYQGHTLAQTVLGDAQRVASYDRDAITAYREKYYHPANTVVALAGRINREQVMELVKERFDAWQPRNEAAVYPSTQANQRVVLAVDAPSEQTHLSVSYPGLAMNSRDTYAMLVLNNILGGSMSSRLFQRIRENAGMAYNVYSSASMYPTCGDLQIYAATAPKQARSVLAQMEEERARLLADGITQAELEQGKTQIKTNYVLAQESAYHRMAALGTGLLVRNKLRTPSTVLRGLSRVTAEDVMRVAHKTLGVHCNVAAVGKKAPTLVEWAQKELYGG